VFPTLCWMKLKSLREGADIASKQLWAPAAKKTKPAKKAGPKKAARKVVVKKTAPKKAIAKKTAKRR
jgi:hypothetical protein